MSAATIASFAASHNGRIYGALCERFGLDPGAPLVDYDDVLAWNMRAAVAAVADRARRERRDDEDPVDRTRRLARETA